MFRNGWSKARDFQDRRPKAGVPNKVTAEIKALAQQYAPASMKELARLALKAESEQARVAAIKEILDRAYGKSPQSVTADLNVNMPLAAAMDEIKRRRNAR
jgi:hypothetical protein